VLRRGAIPSFRLDSENWQKAKTISDPKTSLVILSSKLSCRALVCIVGVMGPSRFAGAGRDALPRVRRYMSRRFFCCFCERAQHAARWSKPAISSGCGAR
jgi:hypothetical protein